MDLITGAGVTVTVIVPLPRERMWELITAVERIGEWSPETVGASWSGEGRFTGRNRFPDGAEFTVSCVVTECREHQVFAWDVLDDTGEAGSCWRYELTDGTGPGTTVVRQSFQHGPGTTGARLGDDFSGRLTTLCSNMVTTISGMAPTTGVRR